MIEVRADDHVLRGERGIGTGVHYLSVAEHPYYRQKFGWKAEQWPNALRIGRRTASLPLSPKPTDADVRRVVAGIRAVLGKG